MQGFKGDKFMDRLTTEEIKKLYRKNREGDLEARKELIKYNIPLVRALAGKYAFKAGDYDDLFQEGCLGLLKALQKYDPDKGVKFSTYAVPFILGDMRTYLRKNSSPLKVSRSNYALYKQVIKTQEIMAQELGRRPRLEEIAAKIGCEKEEIVWLMELQHTPLSLQDENADEIVAILGRRDFSFDQTADNLFLKEIINDLPFRERQIIVLRYFLDKSQKEVAKVLNLSQSYISRIERKVLQDFKREVD